MSKKLFSLILAILSCTGADSQPIEEWTTGNGRDHLPRITGTELLVGYPAEWIKLTLGNKTFDLQENNARDMGWLASISADGTIAASVLTNAFSRPVVVTRLLKNPKSEWIEHDGLQCFRGAIAISPDGSRIVCETHDSNRHNWNLSMLELRSGRITSGPDLPEEPGRELSWSPDGRYVAFEMPVPDHSIVIDEIYLYDTKDSSIKKLRVGQSPRWSPSGDQIAFVDYRAQSKRGDPATCYAGKCYDESVQIASLMDTNGNLLRRVMTFRSYVYGAAPVWSPDSKTLLINRSHNADLDSFDIYLVDLATGKTVKRCRNTVPVLAWVQPATQ
jgi:WD40-like Beta Propeller Repeat